MTNDEYIKELQTKIVQQSKEISRLNEKCILLRKENHNLANTNRDITNIYACFDELKYLINKIESCKSYE